MAFRIFLRDWNDFVAEIDFGSFLEYFYRIELGIRIFLSEEKRELKFGLRKFLSKKAKRGKKVGREKICPSKRDKESKVKQVRRGVRSPVR